MIALFIAATLVLVLFALFLVVFLVIQRQKQNAFLLETQRLNFTHHNEILRTRIEEQENTMHEISKEVHDNIKSKLAGVQVNIKRLRSMEDGDLRTRLLNTTIEMLELTIDDTRKISHSLNTDFVKKKGLIPLLQNELEYIGMSHEMKCRLHIEGDLVEFEPGMALQLYRITQEAIQNILKHAKANTIDISLNLTMPGTLVMKIEDNGIGFDADNVLSFSNGEGLMNMRQRSEVLNADLEIKSAPGLGCKISLTLNITNGSEFAHQDSYS
jgi:signal transduction histidine kinase